MKKIQIRKYLLIHACTIYLMFCFVGLNKNFGNDLSYSCFYMFTLHCISQIMTEARSVMKVLSKALVAVIENG